MVRLSTLHARQHAGRQLELTLVHRLPPTGERAGSRRAETHALDLFLFSPYQLGMTRRRYSVDAFFGDLVSYTRLRTPQIELTRLVDPACEASPLTRLARALAERDREGGIDAAAISFELRTLVNVFRSQTRDRRHAIRDSLRAGTLPIDDVVELCQRLVDEIGAVSAALDGLAPLFLNAGIPDDVLESYRWADELLSIRSEKNFIRMHRDLAEFPGLDELRSTLRARAAAEEERRRERGYDTWVEPGDTRRSELFVYRDGVLKKWAESCMYLSVQPSRALNRVLQVLFAVAAAVAMAFAVLASLLAAQWFPEGSTTWALLAVLAYAFKDRIKEGLRAAFLRALPRLVADRVQHLRAPAGQERAGRARERVSFPAPSQVPPDVHRARYRQPDPLRAVLPPEDVLHFHRDIRVSTDDIAAAEPRTDAIVDLLRLDLREWCLRMDDPRDHILHVEKDEVRETQADRVYHVNAVVRLSSGEDAVEADALLARYRVVLTRHGILRIEDVGT